MLGGLISILGTIFDALGTILNAILAAGYISENKGNWVGKSAAIIAAVFLICFLLIYAYKKYNHIW